MPTGQGTKAAGVVGAGMLGMNVLAYAFVLVSAHLLGPAAFGGLSALMGILIIANVGALALQATAARRLAVTDPTHVAAVTHDVLRGAGLVATAFGVVLLLLVPLINRLLHLDDLLAPALVAVACVPLTLMGAQAGIVQGERRWGHLAAIFVSMGVGRVALGTLALALSPTVRSAMVGIALGSVLPALVGAYFCRWRPSVAAEPVTHEPLLGELYRNGHELLAFFALTNIDVLLARNLLSEHDSGIYAAGAIIAKTCLFFPGFVVVTAFPKMAAHRTGRPWLAPLTAVCVLGSLATVGAALLPELAVAFAGGDEYSELQNLAWLFALEGTVFACLQILVYDAIAGQTHRAPLVWAGVTVVVVTALAAVSSVAGLVVLVIGVAGGLGVASILLSSGGLRSAGGGVATS
jgi:O-antigen/teichoic acid export membrane protein